MNTKPDLFPYLTIVLATLALGLLVALGVAPITLLYFILACLLACLLAITIIQSIFPHVGLLAPLTIAASPPLHAKQPLLLPDPRQRFLETLHHSINTLPLSVTDKQTLHAFALHADKTLSALMQSEKIPVVLSNVYFGALTVTFRLRLRDFSRANLDKLMKLDDLLVQALAVESVRLIPGAGHIDCEISSPVSVHVNAHTLLKHTQGTVIALGLDTRLQPVALDIKQHGLIVAIAPSRRGKTQALRTLLYLLKRQTPTINLVIVAFKRADWQAFDHCAALIFEGQELHQFQTWLLASMYEKARTQDHQPWVVVFDDLVNLLALSPELQESVVQFASLGAGVGVTTIVSTQFSGKASGGVATFANATARLLFKPSSNLQGARDGGFASLGLDQLSTAKGDALLIVDGNATRLTTAMTPDASIESLTGNKPDRPWIEYAPQNHRSAQAANLSMLAIHPLEQYIETLNGWLLDEGVYDWQTGKFTNRSEALRRLGWSANGYYRHKLSEFEAYIHQQSERLL